MAELDRILTDKWPFGPIDATQVDEAIQAGVTGADQLFDRTNLIYSQVVGHLRPTYIIGRKGAGKTAFLLSSTLRGGPPTEVLRTSNIYYEMRAVLDRYRAGRGQLFVDHIAEIWLALFDQVALFHVWRTASRSDPPAELQELWDYFGPGGEVPGDATTFAERFLAQLQRRIMDESVVGLREVLECPPRGGIAFARARQAANAILHGRRQPLIIVMDNLEDLQQQLDTLHPVLAGLFGAVGKVIARNQGDRPYGLQICLPSELFEQIHAISAAPEKDFRGSYLKIYWTANELLKLAGARLQLYLRTHYPAELDRLSRRSGELGEPDPDIALLRAALPETVVNGFGANEDPMAYLLRHTQLLPRQLIEILNCVFTVHGQGSQPWAVTQEAVLAGTRTAEVLIVEDIIAAHLAPFPFARLALNRLANKLDICFPASQLHVVFNHEGIAKLTGLDFDEFLSMLFAIGALGVWFDRTTRYNKAYFQYTLDSTLNADEGTDHLCFHPLFTRNLHMRSLPRLRKERALATYPQGSESLDEDYRFSLGYAVPVKRR